MLGSTYKIINREYKNSKTMEDVQISPNPTLGVGNIQWGKWIGAFVIIVILCMFLFGYPLTKAAADA